MKFINEIYDKSGFCSFPDINKYAEGWKYEVEQHSEKANYKVFDSNHKSRNLFSKIRSIEAGKLSILRSVQGDKRIMSRRYSNSSGNRNSISRNKRTVHTIASLYRMV